MDNPHCYGKMDWILKIGVVKMNEIEQAIEEFYDNAFHKSMKLTISEQSKAVALSALQEKAERNKMRCENCKQNIPEPDSPEDGLCDIKRLFDFKDTDYCSYFEPKENENG